MPGDAQAGIPSDDQLLSVLEWLRREGYRLVPQQFEAALATLRLVRAEGSSGPMARRLPFLLTPILAASPSEQTDLHRRLSSLAGPRPVVVGRVESSEQTGVPEVARGGRRWPVMLAAAGVLVLGLLLAYAAYQPDLSPPVEELRVADRGTSTRPAETKSEEITTVFIVVNPLYGVVKWFLILAPLLALQGWLGYRWWLQQRWIMRGRREGDLDILDLGHRTAGAALFAAPELAALAQQWRRFRKIPTRDIDPEHSVAATLDRGGLFTPVYRTRPLAPEYVVLIEEESRHDHFARLADVAMDRLAAEGVPIERYYYCGGLEHLRPSEARGETRILGELQAQAPHRSLVVVGSGTDLFEPLSSRLDRRTLESLDAWPHRVLLSTRPIPAWDDRELALLDSGLALGTASLRGLRAFGEHVASAHPKHARLVDGILLDRGARPLVGRGPLQTSLADLIEALRARLRAVLSRDLPDRARASFAEALDLLDDLTNVPSALDVIARAGDLAGAEAFDAPRLVAAVRERLHSANLTEAEERLLYSVKNGKPAVFTGGEPEARTLRAEVIRNRCINAFRNVKIDAEAISVVGARIVGVLDLEALEVSLPLRVIHCVLEERPNFTGTKLKLLDLSGTRCVKGIDAAYLEVTTNLILGEGFSAEGNVCFSRAKIHGDLDCTGGRFANRREPTSGRPVLDVERATIDGSVLLRRGFTADGRQPLRFQAEGEVRLSRARIGGDLDCSGGRFTKRGSDPALAAIGVDIGGSAFLRERFSAQGEVSLYESKIGGNLDCGKGSFMNPGATALNATGARVGGFLTWCEVSSRGRIILEYASVNQLVDEVESWPVHGELLLNGFEYKGFAEKAPRDAKSRLDWLERQPEFTPQSYEQLVGVLRRIGHEGDARKVAIEKQVTLRKSGLLPWTARAWNLFLGFTVGHGYRPWRAFELALVVILFGWAVFLNADSFHIMVPAKEEASVAQSGVANNAESVWLNQRPVVAALSSLGYSLDVFLPVVNLGQEERWLPDRNKPWGQAVWAYMRLHVLLGWILTFVTTFALVRYSRRRLK